MGRCRYIILAGAALLASCDQGAKEVRRALDRAESEEALAAARELDATLDALETRLHSGRATVRLWQELASRHRGVSEVACKNAQEHASAMVAADLKDRRQIAARRLALTARQATTTDARVSGWATPATAKPPRPPGGSAP